MKGWIIYIAIGLMLQSCTGNKNRLPDLKETYSRQDANPFGAWVAYQQLNQLFAYNRIKNINEKFSQRFIHHTDTGSLYVNVSRNYFPDEADIETLMAFVAAGNTAFITAANFDTLLLHNLGVNLADTYDYPAIENMMHTSVRFVSPPYHDSARYQFFYLPLRRHFQRLHPDARVLGVNADGMPNFVLVYHRLGRFYLHCEPRIFSNYFLAQPSNYKYLQQMFMYATTEPDNLYWDDYYHMRNTPPGKKSKKGTWGILYSYPAMAWATSLALAMLLLFVLFARKRRQRIVPEIAPNENTSVAFTQTVSQLYFQQHNNRDIADKQIHFLLENIRTRYFISTATINEATLLLISRKSGYPEADTRTLFNLVSQIQEQAEISDSTLLRLNQLIENFYQNHHTDGRKPV